jgi:hypothetical protein
MNLVDVTTLAFIGDVMTLVGVVIAVVTIFVAFISTRRQRDLDALMQLSKHLTAWHDVLVNLTDVSIPTAHQDPSQTERFKHMWEHMGQIFILNARLGERKRYLLFGSKKYKEVTEASICFVRWALSDKDNLSLLGFHDSHDSQLNKQLVRCGRLGGPTAAYKKAMDAIARCAGLAEQPEWSDIFLYLMLDV